MCTPRGSCHPGATVCYIAMPGMRPLEGWGSLSDQVAGLS